MMIQSVLNLRMTVKNEVKERMQKAFLSGESMKVTHDDRDYFGLIAALYVHSETGLHNDVTVSIKTIQETVDPPLLCPDRIGRSAVQVAREHVMRIITQKEILAIDQYPSLHRDPIDMGVGHDRFEQYATGPAYITGDFVLRLNYDSHFKAGEPVELRLRHGKAAEYTRWHGRVERWCMKQNDNAASSDFGKLYTQLTLRPLGMPGVVHHQQPNKKESTMKVFETIVVAVNEQNVVTEVKQGVKLVVATDAQAAKDSTLVDYAAENKLTGKDLAGFKVRTREFCA